MSKQRDGSESLSSGSDILNVSCADESMSEGGSEIDDVSKEISLSSLSHHSF